MLVEVRDRAFPFIKNMDEVGMDEAGSAYAQHINNAMFLINSPVLLANMVG